MAGRNGMGPLNEGLMTGRRMGNCRNNNNNENQTFFGRGFGNGFGRGFGRRGSGRFGFGFRGNGFVNGNSSYSKEELEDRVKAAEEELSFLKKLLNNMEK